MHFLWSWLFLTVQSSTFLTATPPLLLPRAVINVQAKMNSWNIDRISKIFIICRCRSSRSANSASCFSRLVGSALAVLFSEVVCRILLEPTAQAIFLRSACFKYWSLVKMDLTSGSVSSVVIWVTCRAPFISSERAASFTKTVISAVSFDFRKPRVGP